MSMFRLRGVGPRRVVGGLCAAFIVFFGGVAQAAENVVVNADFREGAKGGTHAPRIVAFGDSITEGVIGIRPEENWLRLLQERIGDRAVLFNAGVGGNSAREAMARFGRDVLAREPDVVLIEFGGNNHDPKCPDRQVKDDEFVRHLEAFRAGLPVGCRVVAVTFPPVRDDWHAYGRHESFPQGLDAAMNPQREILRDFARRNGWAILDLYGLLKPCMDEVLLRDGVHLNPRGQQAFASAAERILESEGLLAPVPPHPGLVAGPFPADRDPGNRAFLAFSSADSKLTDFADGAGVWRKVSRADGLKPCAGGPSRLAVAYAVRTDVVRHGKMWRLDPAASVRARKDVKFFIDGWEIQRLDEELRLQSERHRIVLVGDFRGPEDALCAIPLVSATDGAVTPFAELRQLYAFDRPGNVKDTPEELVALDLTRPVRDAATYAGGAGGWTDRFVYPPVLDFPSVAGADVYELTVTDGAGVSRTHSFSAPRASFADFWQSLPAGSVSVSWQAKDSVGRPIGAAARRTFAKASPFAPGVRKPTVHPAAADCAAIARAIERLSADADDEANRTFARDIARFCEDRFVDWTRPGDGTGAGAARLAALWRALYLAEAYPLDLLKLRALGADTSDIDGSRPDDTAAVQALLDRGGKVDLPKREKPYLISRTLRIGSGTTLTLAPDQRIRLAPRSDCLMIANRDPEKGDRDIAVVGGIWDMDNLRQSPNQAWRDWSEPPRKPLSRLKAFARDYYLGDALYFENVSNLVFRGATIRNPVTYAFHICRVTDFEVSHIRFDFTTENPIKGNMDGIHLDGGCRRGRILDLEGATHDDLVALNAHDVWCAQTNAEISDILIDGIRAEGAHSAVRLLSAPEPVRRVTIRNVDGSFYCYGIGLTHYFPEQPTGLFEDITIEHCRLRQAPTPPGKYKARWTKHLRIDPKVRVNRLFYDDVETGPELP